MVAGDLEHMADESSRRPVCAFCALTSLFDQIGSDIDPGYRGARLSRRDSQIAGSAATSSTRIPGLIFWWLMNFTASCSAYFATWPKSPAIQVAFIRAFRAAKSGVVSFGIVCSADFHIVWIRHDFWLVDFDLCTSIGLMFSSCRCRSSSPYYGIVLSEVS